MQWTLPAKHQQFRGEAGFVALRRLVAQHDAVTELVTIERPDQLFIRPASGDTRSGVRFTRDAFWQVCRAVTAGLSTAIQTVWLHSKLPEPQRQELLIRAYNSLVAARSDALMGWRLVMERSPDKRAAPDVAVGLVSGKYQYVSNHTVLEMARSKMAASGTTYQFVRGSIRNRDMMLTLAGADTVPVDRELRVRQGVGVVNSETTHRAIFFPRIVFDNLTGAYAMEPESARNRITHRKRKQFWDLMEGVVTEVFKSEIERGKLVRAYQRMRSSALHQGEAALISRVAKFAVGHQISTDVAAEVAKRFGESPDVPRTLWTVYAAFLKTADQSTRFDRQLRQCAFRLVRG